MSDPDDIDDSDELPPDPVMLRAKLRARIAARRSEISRLEALQQAFETVTQDQLAAVTRCDDAVGVLNKLRREQSQDLAYRYLNGGAAVDPIPAAEAELEVATAEDRRLSEIRRALIDEISRVQLALKNDFSVSEAVTSLVFVSPELQLLRQQHDEALQRLRTVKTALRAVAAVLYGPPSQALSTEALHMEKMERGFGPLDEAFVAQWAEALAQLETNADAVLPGAQPVQPQRPIPLQRTIPMPPRMPAPAPAPPNGSGD